MNNIILDERAYAEHSLDNMTLGESPIATVNIVARYFHENGYTKDETISALERFVSKCDQKASMTRWRKIIKYQAGIAHKYKLIDMDGVSITKAELELVRNIKGQIAQKLMFALICLAKYSDAINEANDGWVNRPDKDIFMMANVCITRVRRALLVNDLWRAGYVQYSKVVNNINLKVTCLDYEGECAVFISDFRNLGNRYLMLLNDNYVECESCGLVIRKNSNSHKYCKSCATKNSYKE